MAAPSPQARLTLQDAFERFATTVTPDDQLTFNNTKLKDVRDEAIKIERQLRARRTQRNMARLEPFLRGMDHYSKVVEVLCNGTPYLSWIWAPVKLMLMITVDSLDAFEKLIDAYGKIADMMPRLDRLENALGDDHNCQNMLALIYSDILEFHQRAYKFVRRKSWAIFFGSMWTGFESRFGAILNSLAHHGELLDKEATAAHISDAVTHHKEATEKWERQEREWQAVKVRAVLSWLATNNTLPQDTLERHCDNCLPNSCDWFIQHTKTQMWLKDGAEKPLLWLYGKPGAGKSVICSNLVQHAKASGINVFFYFCSYLGDSSEDCSHILRSLASQIIEEHQDLAIYVYDVCFQSHPIPSRKALLGLLPELLQGLSSVRFIIDGIDEWSVCDQKELLKDLTQIISIDPLSCICKILIASRDTLEISRSLRKKNKAVVSIYLSDDQESQEISRSIGHFVDKRLSDLPDHLDDLITDAFMLTQIKQTLLDKCNGMFLWVRLVLDSLEAVYSPEALRAIINDLPSDLYSLYERVFARLCSAPGPHGYGGVSRIFSWICATQRPLHKQELLHGLAVSPFDAASISRSVPLVQILDHCKPFLEERPDSTIVFVHFSVKEYFLRSKAPQIVSTSHGQQDISSACAVTLTRSLALLHPRVSPSDLLVQIASGSYRLLPYALEFWVEHCLLYASAGGPLDLDQLVPRRLIHLHDRHDHYMQKRDANVINSSSNLEASEPKHDPRLTPFAHIPIQGLMSEVLHTRLLASQHGYENGEDAEAFSVQSDRTLFSKLASTFSSTVIHLLSQDQIDSVPKETLDAFKTSYASTAFRCRYPYCPRSSAGFATQELRTQHEAGHLQRVYCKVTSCQYNRVGFTKERALNSHTKKYHTEKPSFSIPPRVRRSTEADEGSNAHASASIGTAETYPAASEGEDSFTGTSFSPILLPRGHISEPTPLPLPGMVAGYGETTLYRECEKGDLDAVKAAFENAPDRLDQADFAGIAPLHIASMYGWVDIVQYLISKGCITACSSRTGNTPLIGAVGNGHLGVVKLLLETGVDPHHRDKKGQRAIDVVNYNHEYAMEIKKELREAMVRDHRGTELNHGYASYSPSGSSIPNNDERASSLVPPKIQRSTGGNQESIPSNQTSFGAAETHLAAVEFPWMEPARIAISPQIPRERLVSAQNLLRENPGIIRAMDDRPVPLNILNSSIRQMLPPEVKSWKELKQWAHENLDQLTFLDADGNQLLVLQILHYQDSMQQRSNGFPSIQPPQQEHSNPVNLPPVAATPERMDIPQRSNQDQNEDDTVEKTRPQLSFPIVDESYQAQIQQLEQMNRRRLLLARKEQNKDNTVEKTRQQLSFPMVDESYQAQIQQLEQMNRRRLLLARKEQNKDNTVEKTRPQLSFPMVDESYQAQIQQLEQMNRRRLLLARQCENVRGRTIPRN